MLTTTEDHPFWSVTDRQFERADQLAKGEKVLTSDGRTLTVTGLKASTVHEGTAYNLTIADIHTYHVGDETILVHNDCGEGKTVQLFRNVDAAEFDSIADTGKFTVGDGMMEGKWFATTGGHAEQWGAKLSGGNGLTVETRVPRSVANFLHHEGGKLDGIGPGRYADSSGLDQINKSMDGIRLWP